MLITWNIPKINNVFSSAAQLANSVSMARTNWQQGIDSSVFKVSVELWNINMEGTVSSALRACLSISHTLDKICVYPGMPCQSLAKVFSFNPTPFRPPLCHKNMEVMFQPPDSRRKTSKYFGNTADPI